MPTPQRPTPRKKNKPLSVIAVGVGLAVASLFVRHDHDGMLMGGIILIAIGTARLLTEVPQILRSIPSPFPKPLPKKEVMKLAEARNGLLTLSEITTTLDIDPAIAQKTLNSLSTAGIAHQRWQEYKKNLWEFPDYLKLPITQTLDLAKRNGGRISLSDLLASGQPLDIATQTLDTLSEKGLAHQDPAATTRAVILTTQ